MIGRDLHARQQTIAMVDTDTGELVERILEPEGEKVDQPASRLAIPLVFVFRTFERSVC